MYINPHKQKYMRYTRDTSFMSDLNRVLPKKPRLELSHEQLAHMKRASEIVLAIIAVAGMATLTVVAPNALHLLSKVFSKRHKRYYTTAEKHKKLAETFYYLKRSGFIRMQRTKRGWRFFLTNKGHKRLEGVKFENLRIPKPETWDASWWLVAADIPTKTNRIGADCLRNKLKQMGFYPLQRTLWLYPYDPCTELEFVVREYHVEHFVTVMQVRKLDTEDAASATKHFKHLGIIA